MKHAIRESVGRILGEVEVESVTPGRPPTARDLEPRFDVVPVRAAGVPVPTDIEKAPFGGAWSKLCARLGRTPDRDEALAYHRYLERMGVTTEEAVAACETLWATARFFPRPADFLAIKAEEEWREVVRLASGDVSPERVQGRWRSLSWPARQAIESFGGLDGVRRANDLVRMRTAFLDAYERSLATQANRSATET